LALPQNHQVRTELTIADMTVSRIGLGTNRITDTPAARQLLMHAVERGVNFIDTAHRYTNGASETAIGATFSNRPRGLVIATKGGLTPVGPSGSPSHLRTDLEDSLRRLRTDCIDLYQLHRIDQSVPFENQLDVLISFQKEGKIRHIGLSEVTTDQLRFARTRAPIVSVQNQYNVLVREHEDLVDYCTQEDIAFIPWFPLGGLAGGAEKVSAALKDMAQTYKSTPQQIAIAWLLKRSPQNLPIPGTLSIQHLEENIAASEIHLSQADYARLTNP
jgi:pyridoxine 4-dehydrogenase